MEASATQEGESKVKRQKGVMSSDKSGSALEQRRRMGRGGEAQEERDQKAKGSSPYILYLWAWLHLLVRKTSP